MDEDPAAERLTARERRAQRVRQESRRQAPIKAAKTAGIWLAVAVAVSGIVWGFQYFQPPEFTHVHTAFRMYVEDEDISFMSPAYDAGQTGYLRGHLHMGDQVQHILHIEGSPGVGLRLEQFFLSAKVDFRDQSVKLDPAQPHNSREWSNNATHSWQLWLNKCTDGSEAWAKQPKMASFEPHQHDRMLIVYTRSNATAEDLASKFATVPTDDTLQSVAKDECNGRSP